MRSDTSPYRDGTCWRPPLHFGSIIAISETFLLAGTWRWTLQKKQGWLGWREKAALWGLLSASLAVVLLLSLVLILHFHENSNFAGMFFLVENVAGIVLGLAGIVLGILGSGSPRVASLIWSLVVLASIILVSIATLARENVCFDHGEDGIRSVRAYARVPSLKGLGSFLDLSRTSVRGYHIPPLKRLLQRRHNALLNWAAFSPTAMAYTKLTTQSDLPANNEAKEFPCGKKTICVANVNGTIAAMDNVCLHRGGPLGQGVIENGKVVCPWHGWSFDTATGEATHNAKAKVAVYPIKIENGHLMIEV